MTLSDQSELNKPLDANRALVRARCCGCSSAEAERVMAASAPLHVESNL